MQKERPPIRPDEAWQFVAALTELPLSDWLNVAAETPSRGHEAAASDVRRLIRESGAGLMAWFLTDAIDTAEWCCLHAHANRRDGRRQAQVGITIAAARTAALAILVRPRLGEERFRLLYAPFASLLPIDPSPEDGPSREVFMDSLCAAQRGHANVQVT